MAATDDIIARARGDLQRAESAAQRAREALAKAEAEAADLQAFIRTYQRYVSEPSPSTAREHGVNARQPAKAGSRARELVDAAIDAIKAAGKPLPISDLLYAVMAAGHTVGGADQKSNLAGYLSRDPRIVSRGRAIGWDIEETEGAALEPASGETAPSNEAGGTDERSTLTSTGLGDFEDLIGSPSSQVP